mgnify:CR=1 FL=1
MRHEMGHDTKFPKTNSQMKNWKIDKKKFINFFWRHDFFEIQKIQHPKIDQLIFEKSHQIFFVNFFFNFGKLEFHFHQNAHFWNTLKKLSKRTQNENFHHPNQDHSDDQEAPKQVTKNHSLLLEKQVSERSRSVPPFGFSGSLLPLTGPARRS